MFLLENQDAFAQTQTMKPHLRSEVYLSSLGIQSNPCVLDRQTNHIRGQDSGPTVSLYGRSAASS